MMTKNWEFLRGLEGVYRQNENLAAWTGFAVGGPADHFFLPRRKSELKQIVQGLREAGVPLLILGRGSNVLVSDRGVRGAVLITSELREELSVRGRILTVDAGYRLAELCAWAARHDLSGLEGLCGIPGSVGGAALMNAGAYEQSFADHVKELLVLDSEGNQMRVAAKEAAFAYRSSRFQKSGEIVLSATFELEFCPGQMIYERMADFQTRRRQSQPLSLPSAGSAFKRPEGHFAGKLITEAGLKGHRGRGCSVSGRHAGFIVRDGDASAEDLRQLFMEVSQRVEEASGVRLIPEVRLVGDWGDAAWIY